MDGQDMPRVIVETARLIVREWVLDDAEDAFVLYGDPAVTATLPDAMRRVSRETTRAWLAGMERQQAADPTPEGLGLWAVVERASGRVVGGAQLQQARINGQEQVELGYHLARAAWGNGYATEVASALRAYGFETLGLRRIVGVVLPDNHASRRVPEKIGMHPEGLGDYDGFPVEVLAAEQRA
jgi:ribosomal-protein-alanine N-acetyltransferase